MQPNKLLNQSQSERRARLLSLLRQKSLLRGQFVLASGQTSDYYIDARLTSLSAEGLSLISSVLYHEIQSLLSSIDALACPVLGACPIASGLSQMSYLCGHPLDVLYIRKESKSHGTQKNIEGSLRPNMRVLVIEDVITTGQSALAAVDALRHSGCTVTDLYCLLLRDDTAVQLAKDKYNVTIHSVFRVSDLLAG